MRTRVDKNEIFILESENYMFYGKLTGLFVGLVLICLIPVAWAADTSRGSLLVAQVGNKKIFLGELKQAQPAQFLNANYRTYMAERDALTKAIDEALLQEAASKEHLTVDQLLERHVKNQVKDPSDETIRVFYETMNSTQPYSEVKGEILAQIRKLREDRLREEYMKSLRAEGHVVVLLEPPYLDVAADGAPSIGPKDAPVTLIEYADYQCPYCRQEDPVLKKLREHYADRLRFVFKDFPLPMHPQAQKAAEAALCAGEQGDFWPYHDQLYSGMTNLEVPQLKALARSLKLDGPEFDKCLDSGKQAAAVKQTLNEALQIGLSGTPSFFVNGHYMSGSLTYDTLNALVEQQLEKKPQGNAGADHGRKVSLTSANGQSTSAAPLNPTTP